VWLRQNFASSPSGIYQDSSLRRGQVRYKEAFPILEIAYRDPSTCLEKAPPA
jgi:hypothetical protein